MFALSPFASSPVMLIKSLYVADRPYLGLDVLDINTQGPPRFASWSERPTKSVAKAQQKRKTKKSIASKSRRRNRGK